MAKDFQQGGQTASELLRIICLNLTSKLSRQIRVGATYVGRVLRLTLLAPDIIEEIMAGDNELNCNSTVC